MFNISGYDAVIHCDGCQIELSRGPYPMNAEDNLPPECHIVHGDDETPNEHYCSQCMIDELNEQLDMAREAGMSQSSWNKQHKK